MTTAGRIASPQALLLAAVAGAVLGACGTGLYDSAGVPPTQQGPLCVDPGVVACGGNCVTEDADHCGQSCATCPTPNLTRNPAAATRACIDGAGAGGKGACGYECGGGFLHCADGCCGALQLASGDAFTCALLEDTSVKCWGANDAGQVTRSPTAAPQPFPHTVVAAGATAIAAGARHACAVVGGAIQCWGADDAGQSAAPPSTAASAVAAGARHTCAIRTGGAVTCWGDSADGKLAVPFSSGATDLAAGADHTCAVVTGAVQCWGRNASGQLGNGSTTGTSSSPQLPLTIARVAARQNHTCVAAQNAVQVSGTNTWQALWCWGDILGAAFAFATPQLTPAIPMKSGNASSVRFSVTALSTGRTHVCAIGKGGAADPFSCFGTTNTAGQLGVDTQGAGSTEALPVSITTAAGSRSPFVSGDDHTCAIALDSSVRCFGDNSAGQLGDGTTDAAAAGTYVKPSGL